MEILIVKTVNEWSDSAAEIVCDVVRRTPSPVLILPTGETPVPFYDTLVERYCNGDISFKRTTTYNLDEYYPLAPNHSQSYRSFMQQQLFNHIDILRENTHLPDGLAADADAACLAYEQALTIAGEADLAVLGIGHNGHIGFNEPGSSFDSPARRVCINELTRQANARFFDSLDQVPTYAVTLGIGAIMRSRRILLLVRGADKADILYQALTGPVTELVPASILQKHPRLQVVADLEAGRHFI